MRETKSLRDESSRDGGVQSVDCWRVTLSREEARGEESNMGKRVMRQEEPREMKAVIKRLASERYGRDFPADACNWLITH